MYLKGTGYKIVNRIETAMVQCGRTGIKGVDFKQCK